MPELHGESFVKKLGRVGGVFRCVSVVSCLMWSSLMFHSLEDFKKQAFPNMSVLQRRLEVAGQNLVDLASSGLDVISHAWLYVIEQIKGSPEVRVTAR